MARFQKSWTAEGTFDRITSCSLHVLIACISRDEGFQNALSELDIISEYFSCEMDVYYALEDVFSYFKKNYGVSGTPAYLIVHKGRVLGTVFGKKSVRALIKRFSIILLDHERSISARVSGNKKSVEKEKAHDRN